MKSLIQAILVSSTDKKAAIVNGKNILNLNECYTTVVYNIQGDTAALIGQWMELVLLLGGNMSAW